MSKKEEVAVVETRPLKPAVLELSKALESNLQMNKGDGVVSEIVKGDCYMKNLPENITPEHVEALSEYNTNFPAASLVAVGNLTTEAMSKNKKLSVVTAEIAMGPKDVVRHAIHRSKDFSFGSGADRKTTTKIGATTTEIDVKGGHNSGQLKIARQMVGAMITEKLGK